MSDVENSHDDKNLTEPCREISTSKEIPNPIWKAKSYYSYKENCIIH